MLVSTQVFEEFWDFTLFLMRGNFAHAVSKVPTLGFKQPCHKIGHAGDVGVAHGTLGMCRQHRAATGDIGGACRQHRGHTGGLGCEQGTCARWRRGGQVGDLRCM